MIQLQKIANREKRTDTKSESVHNTVEISIQDLNEFFDSARDRGFVERVRINTSRYISIFSQVIDSVMPQPSRQLGEDEQSTFDIVMQQRRFNNANSHQQMVSQGLIRNGEHVVGPGGTKMGIPPELER